MGRRGPATFARAPGWVRPRVERRGGAKHRRIRSRGRRPLIRIHPAAAAEAKAARLRYAERDPAVARRFLAEYDRALERIRDHPERWPLYPHVPGGFAGAGSAGSRTR